MSDRVGWSLIGLLWAIGIGCVVFTSCAGAPVYRSACTTRCGLHLREPLPDAWSCLQLQEAEDRALRVFARTPDPRMDELCADLQGWVIWVQPATDWDNVTPSGTQRVSGLTRCDVSLIEVGTSAIFRGALVHELAHVAQHCEPRGPLGPPYERMNLDDEAHAYWTRDQIYDAIDTVNAGRP